MSEIGKMKKEKRRGGKTVTVIYTETMVQSKKCQEKNS